MIVRFRDSLDGESLVSCHAMLPMLAVVANWIMEGKAFSVKDTANLRRRLQFTDLDIRWPCIAR